MTTKKKTILVTSGIAVAVAALVAGTAVAVGQSSAGAEERAGAGSTSAGSGTSSSASPKASASASTAPGAAAGSAAATVSAACAKPTTTVSSASALTKALKSAKAGTVIRLEDGTYKGEFDVKADGTTAKPIAICGTSRAKVGTGSTSDGYGIHIDGADDVVLDGFTVTTSQKGVMIDDAQRATVRGLTVTGIGDEAIHVRENSSDARILGNTISSTGKRKADYGEGIYVGSAESNWGDVTKGEPDRSDRALIEGNRISRTTAEAIDVKEGTTGGTIRGNTFDGTGMSAADSWVDIKGNDWTITGNVGTDSPEDGFQTHEIVDGWGTGNVFSANRSDVDGSGYAINLTKKLTNVVTCDNSATDAGKGLSNADCTPR